MKVEGTHILSRSTEELHHADSDDGYRPRHKFPYRMFKTVVMVMAPAALGVCLELAGPCMFDLRKRVNANYEQIATVLAARSGGYFIGSLFSGFLSDKYVDHVELLLFLAFLVQTFSTIIIPWSGTLAMLGFVFHLQGLAEGFTDANNNVLCLRLWSSKASAPLHALHFGFGVGAMIAPQLARPFISSRTMDTNHRALYNISIVPIANQSTGHKPVDSNLTIPPKLAPIEIPYSIAGVLSFIVSILFLSFYLYDKSREVKEATKPTLKDVKRIFSTASCAPGRTAFVIQLFILVFFFFLNVLGSENAYTKFIYSYAIESGNFNKNTASILETVFWLCFTLGRGFAIIAAHWISPKYLLPTELLFNIICAIVLSAKAYHVPGVLWTFTAIFGLFLAPMFPAGLAWCNLYVEMSGMAVALVFIGGASGGIVYQYLTGYLFQAYGAFTLMYMIMGYAVFVSVVYFLMTVLTCRVEDRFSREEIETEDIAVTGDEN